MEEIDVEKIKENLFSKKSGLLQRIIGKFGKRNVFFIGDLHLDHANIIKYCSRPFSPIEEMNNTIIPHEFIKIARFVYKLSLY